MAILESAPEFTEHSPAQVRLEEVIDDSILEFLGELEIPKSSVDEYHRDIEQPERHLHSMVHTDGVIMTDGLTHAVSRIIPDDPETKVSAGGGVAWFTTHRGHILRLGLHLAENNGQPVFIVGSEQSYRPPRKEGLSLSGIKEAIGMHISNLRGISLHRTGHNFNEIADVIGEDSMLTGIETEDMTLFGESEAGDSGMAALALAGLHHRNYLYGALVGPPFPRGLEASWEDIKGLAGQGLAEPPALIEALANLGYRRIIHHPETIDPNILANIYNLAMTKSMFGGDGGRIAPHVPKEQAIHITAHEKDWTTMQSLWKEKFAEHPNVRVTRAPGSHLTIAHPSTSRIIEEQFSAVIKETERQNTTDPSALDFDRIFNMDDEAA
jgi:hypothetical protein